MRHAAACGRKNSNPTVREYLREGIARLWFLRMVASDYAREREQLDHEAGGGTQPLRNLARPTDFYGYLTLGEPTCVISFLCWRHSCSFQPAPWRRTKPARSSSLRR